MKNFTTDFMVRKLSKEVVSFIQELEQPHRHSNNKDVSKHLERLYRKGIFTKQDYLFCSARVLLNDFSYMVEEHVGRGCHAGFLFYDKGKNLLYYGAGAHYPPSMKKVCVRAKPVVDLEYTTHYKDDVLPVPDIYEWYDNIFKQAMIDDGVKSFTSKRLRHNGLTFGTFEMYFPQKGAATEEEVAFVKEQMQPLKEKLFLIREEMIESVEHAVDNLGVNYSQNPSIMRTIQHLAVMFMGIPLVEGIYPLAGKLINLI